MSTVLGFSSVLENTLKEEPEEESNPGVKGPISHVPSLTVNTRPTILINSESTSTPTTPTAKRAGAFKLREIGEVNLDNATPRIVKPDIAKCKKLNGLVLNSIDFLYSYLQNERNDSEKALYDTYQLRVQAAEEAMRRKVSAEYEKRIDHRQCDLTAVKLNKELEYYKNELNKSNDKNKKLTKELLLLSREKTNLQDDHRILLEDIARAKLEKRVLWSRLSREAEEPKTRPPTENVDANVIEENPKIEWSEIMQLETGKHSKPQWNISTHLKSVSRPASAFPKQQIKLEPSVNVDPCNIVVTTPEYKLVAYPAYDPTLKSGVSSVQDVISNLQQQPVVKKLDAFTEEAGDNEREVVESSADVQWGFGDTDDEISSDNEANVITRPSTASAKQKFEPDISSISLKSNDSTVRNSSNQQTSKQKISGKSIRPSTALVSGSSRRLNNARPSTAVQSRTMHRISEIESHNDNNDGNYKDELGIARVVPIPSETEISPKARDQNPHIVELEPTFEALSPSSNHLRPSTALKRDTKRSTIRPSTANHKGEKTTIPKRRPVTAMVVTNNITFDKADNVDSFIVPAWRSKFAPKSKVTNYCLDSAYQDILRVESETFQNKTHWGGIQKRKT